MDICCKAQAGTMQSSDLLVFVEPAQTLTIDIESTVLKQFEHLIRQRIEDKLDELGVTCGKVRVSDRGALDYAIDARIEAAVKRAQGEK